MRFAPYAWSGGISKLRRKPFVQPVGNLLLRHCGRIYVSPSACSENLLASLPSPSLPLPSASALILPFLVSSMLFYSKGFPTAILRTLLNSDRKTHRVKTIPFPLVISSSGAAVLNPSRKYLLRAQRHTTP